jgi:hypothetical protein
LDNSNENNRDFSSSIWLHLSNVSVLSKYVSYWLHTNQSWLLALSLMSMILLLFIHISVLGMIDMFTTISDNSLLPQVVTALALILIAVIPLPIIHKGIVPVAIAGIGLPLLYAGTLIPITMSSTSISSNFEEIYFITEGYFLLGVSMIVFSIISAYKPTLLYVRNRPKESDGLWIEEYPLWDDSNEGKNNIRISIGRFDDEVNIPLKELMSESEKYLLWRYSLVLVAIHGIRYLASPNSYVPQNSIILRDKNERMLGKDRYNSYFV